ncbi:MAG TPA: Asp23/Gls24 family envelope stress response protein [Firmicutes bacterium]|nr:Asp23/Gls24 family envelope stress response protein [Bacillota bacterium]HAA37978.1 Asp23/Gls24 family envelope stress response protein [Bacillota bacterium]
MTNRIATDLGEVVISEELIATLAGVAAIECYGLVGMSPRAKLKDGIAELLGRDNLSRGVEVTQDENGLRVDLYIIVSYGTKIHEVAANVQEKVKYTLEKLTGLNVAQVNVNVQGVRVTDK